MIFVNNTTVHDETIVIGDIASRHKGDLLIKDIDGRIWTVITVDPFVRDKLEINQTIKIQWCGIREMARDYEHIRILEIV